MDQMRSNFVYSLVTLSLLSFSFGSVPPPPDPIADKSYKSQQNQNLFVLPRYYIVRMPGINPLVVFRIPRKQMNPRFYHIMWRIPK